MKDNRVKNKAGRKYHNWKRAVDRLVKKIDRKAERGEFNIKYHQSENETGRVWSF